ncbi:hypothetical protein CASFOL_042406 [Castilleja foliolosa]|uniref:ATPase AAA-type core domain-containing protein n=1 Tax=Castilleja foliolosa TaxID=1961234 RepID=A0ABD3BAP3_9LAMI
MGKTLLAKTLARLVNVPFVIADATTLTQQNDGICWGRCIVHFIQAAYVADYNVEAARQGIVYIDEVDKITKKVRDRATLYLNTLGDGSVAETGKDVKDFLFGSLDIPLPNLEASLKKSRIPQQSLSSEKLISSIPKFATFGKLFKSSAPVEHKKQKPNMQLMLSSTYSTAMWFSSTTALIQYQNSYLKVTVIVDASEAGEFVDVGTKPLRSLPYNTPAQTFVAFEKAEGVPAIAKFSNVLRFIVEEVDPSTGEAEDDGVEDEYCW